MIMRTLFVALFLVFTSTATAPMDRDFADRAVNFEARWGRFFRTYFGCPKTATDPAQCSFANATFDYTEYLAARREAKKLFDLEDRR